MGDPKTYQFDLPKNARPSWFDLPEPYYPSSRWYNENRASRRQYHPLTGIRAVVIHATAGWTTEHAVNHWKTAKASAHWLVPGENEDAHGKHIWALIDESLAAWHVRNDKSHIQCWEGRKYVNHWSTGIEIVNSQPNDGSTDPFSDWQVRMSALIVRRCWARYPNLKHIVSHARLDPKRRSDPGSQFPWETFHQYCLDNSWDKKWLQIPTHAQEPDGNTPIPAGVNCCS